MNNLIQQVFEIIATNPGIDTPEVCVEAHLEIDKPDNLAGPYLALWLMKNECDSWARTCDAVDELLESGRITFGDDGELRATGYSA